MEIESKNYKIVYDPSTSTITCRGSLWLHGKAGYAYITELFNDIADQQPPAIMLRLRELQILNNPGLNVLARFVMRVRKQNSSRLTIQGTPRCPWQSRSLKKMQRLMPNMTLELE